MKLAQLLRPWISKDLPDYDLTGLNNDSRAIRPGDGFIAYPGASSDGRSFIEKAFESGASAILYDPVDGFSPQQLHLPIPCVPINQLSSKLAEIAARFYEHPGQSLKVTGITGTNGKTTIAYQLAQAHTLLGQKAAYVGTIGQGEFRALQPLMNTTPDALCVQKLLHQYHQLNLKQVCMEVSSHALSQHRVDAVSFSQAIFTNLSQDHLDYHRNMKDYAAAKAKLFETQGLECAVINNDDAYSSLMVSALPKSTRQLSYGIDQDCDIRAIHWHMHMSGSEFEIDSPWGRQKLEINSPGQFNVYNALAVFSSLMASGYSVEQVVDVISKLEAAPGRMEVVRNKPLVIVDYAHTPDALEKVLITLNQLKQGRLWVVFGCGGDRDKAKRPMMGAVASQYADELIITSDNPRNEHPMAIIQDVVEGVSAEKAVHLEADRKKAIQRAISLADENDVIVVAGKGHEDYQQIGDLRQPFSDQDVIKKTENA